MTVRIRGISVVLAVLSIGAAHAQTAAQTGAWFGGQGAAQQGSQAGLGASHGSYRAATAEMNRCAAQVNADQRWAPLFVHLPVSAASPSLQQLADQAYPQPEDVALLGQHHDALAQCRTTLIERLQSVDSQMADLYAQGFAEADQGTLALTERKLTWGAANQARQQKVLAFRQRISSAEREMPEAPPQANAGRPRIMSVMAIGLNAALGLRSARPPEPTCGAGWSYIPCETRR